MEVYAVIATVIGLQLTLSQIWETGQGSNDNFLFFLQVEQRVLQNMLGTNWHQPGSWELRHSFHANLATGLEVLLLVIPAGITERVAPPNNM